MPLNKSPTKKQIKLAEDICNILNIDFPQSSLEFNRYTYWKFINTYMDEYEEQIRDAIYYNYCDDEMAWWHPKEY